MTDSEAYPDRFSPDVAARLKTYVYRLIDPRNGQTFYVGKGQGNRVFAHIRAEAGWGGEDDNPKLQLIREIRNDGFEVAHVIHRHGMDDETAFEVESALIDAYPGLTNIADGHGGNEFGAAHATQIIRAYTAFPAVFHHNALLISINRSEREVTNYEAVRYAWKLSIGKAQLAEVVLATRHGQIVDAFVAHRWMEATSHNFPGRESVLGRYGFEGTPASPDIRNLYVGKRVPDEFRKPGAANPIRYTW